jgi:hypothetical protein
MNIFTISLIVLDFSAAIYYLFHGDYARTVYWISAGTITTSVCFIK